LPLDKNHFERILEAFHRHLLLVFPGQHIDEAQQVAFSRRFGELQVHVLDQYRHPRHPEIYVLSNVDQTGKTTGAHPRWSGIPTFRSSGVRRSRRSSMASRCRAQAATRCSPTCARLTTRWMAE
jgi:hypothetical protein